MKAFEAWMKTHLKIKRYWKSRPEHCEDTWKAALEWVEDIVVHRSDGPCNPKDLILCIEKELAE